MSEHPNPDNLTAVDLAAAMRSGALDPREHIEHVLALAHDRGERLGAFAHLFPERARAQAAHAWRILTDARNHGGTAPALTGVPFPIKALEAVQGEPWQAGSPALAGSIAEHDSPIAARMDAAHTLTVGATTTSEFGMSIFSESPASAPARTPWDIRRTAGGSSGGAATAVAAGIVPIAHGSDAGGSIRVPASATGTVGLVGGRGFISPSHEPGHERRGAVEGIGLARHGAIARTVADLRAALGVLARSHPGDHVPYAIARERLSRWSVHGTARLRIGVIREPMVAHTDIHPEAMAAVDRALEALRGPLVSIREIGPAMTPEQWEAFMPVWTVGAALIPLPWGPAGSPAAMSGEREAGIGALTRWLRERGAHVSGSEYAAAMLRLQELTVDMARSWMDLDVILTPTLSGPPPYATDIPLDGREGSAQENFAFQSRLTPFTSVWNINGFAAMSVPIHRARLVDEPGIELPFGVHVAAAGPWREQLLMDVAEVLEARDPWPRIAPVSSPFDPGSTTQDVMEAAQR